MLSAGNSRRWSTSSTHRRAHPGPGNHPARPTERPERTERGFQKSHPRAVEKTNLWIGAGQRAGIRPGDLVGAIANEAQVDSKLIGPIQIREAFSIVGVPKELADRVILAMQKTTLRGRKVQVRRDR